MTERVEVRPDGFRGVQRHRQVMGGVVIPVHIRNGELGFVDGGGKGHGIARCDSRSDQRPDAEGDEQRRADPVGPGFEPLIGEAVGHPDHRPRQPAPRAHSGSRTRSLLGRESTQAEGLLARG